MRRRVPDAVAAALAGCLLLAVAACSGDAEPEPVRDPAAAASAAIDERELQPQERSGSPSSNADAGADDGSSTGSTDGEPADSGGDADRADGTRSPTAGGQSPGEVIAHYNLGLDDCFDRAESLVSGRQRATTTRLPCSRPHLFQVFGRLDHPAEASDPYPGDTAMEDFALQSCYRMFEQWAGSAYETSALEIEVITPVLSDFSDATYPYRGIHCLVRRDDGAPLVGTARGSGL